MKIVLAQILQTETSVAIYIYNRKYLPTYSLDKNNSKEHRAEQKYLFNIRKRKKSRRIIT